MEALKAKWKSSSRLHEVNDPTVAVRSRSVPRKPSSVFWVFDSKPIHRGALEQHVFDLARRMENRGALTVVFPEMPPVQIRRELTLHGAKVRVLDFSRPFRSAVTLATWLKASATHQIHFHFVRAFSPLVLAARVAVGKVLLHDRLPVKRQVAAVADDSTSTRSIVRELSAGAQPILVGSASVEGLATLIAAVPLLRRHDPILVILGEEAQRAAIFEEARSLGVEESIRFLGIRNDVEKILGVAKIAILPSEEESLGLSASEAMAAGRPVIASLGSPAAGQVLDGICGLLVPKADPWALAGAISRLLEDPLLSARLGRQGLTRAIERARLGGISARS